MVGKAYTSVGLAYDESAGHVIGISGSSTAPRRFVWQPYAAGEPVDALDMGISSPDLSFHPGGQLFLAAIEEFRENNPAIEPSVPALL